MPKVDTTPKGVKPLRFLGVRLEDRGLRTQWVSDCPFCGREDKFYCNIEDGLWDCKICTEKGNLITFMRKLWEEGDKRTTDYNSLAADRGLLFPDTLMRWGVIRSPLTNEWIVPGYNADRKLVQLYRYTKDPVTGRMFLRPTPEAGHGMFLPDDYNPSVKEVHIMEGLWDGMVAWETFRAAAPIDKGRFEVTGRHTSSILANAGLVAVPSCNVLPQSWVSAFAGKGVTLYYDNDHLKVYKNGDGIEKTTPPAGYEGMKRFVKTTAESVERTPSWVRYLHWGDGGFTKDLPDRYDIRDLLTEGKDLRGRLRILPSLFDRVKAIPSEWVAGRSRSTVRGGGLELECVPCSQWSVLRNEWRKAMKWSDGLDYALSVMLAAVASTKVVGDQLWVKVLGPPACGKSTLCEALSVAKKYVLAKSTIRGFHSGFQSDREGVQDNSLVALVKDKTLVTKDGDTLLQSPNLGQILAEARDLYDSVSRTHYRNKMSKSYEGVRMTWILCGTSSLHYLDQSELGERFLDCSIIDTIDEDEEDVTAMRKARQVAREMALMSDGRADTREGEEMVAAKQLTGGYVNYLRENAADLFAAMDCSDAYLAECQRLGKYVAFMRAKPSKVQDDRAEREMCYRLTSQMVRLAYCLAVVLNRPMVDEVVMARVRKVARDTTRGRSVDICRVLAAAGREGETAFHISKVNGRTEASERNRLVFLRKIKAVESFEHREKPGMNPRLRWRLTERFGRLFREVTDGRHSQL